MVQNLDELLDIVNEHDEVIGTQWRSEQKPQGGYLRCVLAFLVNDAGQICILRRSAHKAAWPSTLALVGGCVSSGEHYELAFKREVAEEINLDVERYEYRLLGVVKPWETNNRFFKGIYEIKVTHQDIAHNPEDFSEYFWLTPREMFEPPFIQDTVAPDLLDLIKKFYSHQLP